MNGNLSVFVLVSAARRFFFFSFIIFFQEKRKENMFQLKFGASCLNNYFILVGTRHEICFKTLLITSKFKRPIMVGIAYDLYV